MLQSSGNSSGSLILLCTHQTRRFWLIANARSLNLYDQISAISAICKLLKCLKWKFDGNAETGFASSAPVQTSQILKIIWVVAETVEIFICLLLMHVYQLNSSFRSFNWTMNICILIILSCPRTKTVVECMCWHLLFTCLQLFPRILSFTSLAVISIWWSILWLLSTYVIQKKTLSDQLK